MSHIDEVSRHMLSQVKSSRAQDRLFVRFEESDLGVSIFFEVVPGLVATVA